MLETMPSKSEEIEHFREFVAGLPRSSYLREMFAGSEEYVTQLIRSDLVEPLPQTLQSRSQELKVEYNELLQKRESLASEVRHLERTIDVLRDQIGDIEHLARKIQDAARR